jgi:hypothetical protein
MSLKPAVSNIHRSLSELPDLDAATRGKVLRKLHDDGYLVDDRAGTLFAAAAPRSQERSLWPSPMAAAAAQPENAQRIRAVLASAHRLGAVIDESQPINIHDLNRQLVGRDITERFRIKSELFLLGMIEP